MSDTSSDPGSGADPDEAAFQRLEQGLAALRRDPARMGPPTPGAGGALHDPRELDASLAEVNRRIDALASRVGAPSDPAPIDLGPILAAVNAVEAKLSSLTTRLDRAAEQSALTEAMAAANARIDSLAARLDARLNQLQDRQAEFSARLTQTGVGAGTLTEPKTAARSAPVPPASSPVLQVPPPPRPPTPNPSRQSAFAVLSKTEAEVRRSHLPALMILVLMVLAAAASLAWIRPDLVKSDWIRQEWLEPVRDKAKHWLTPTPATSEIAPATGAAPSGQPTLVGQAALASVPAKATPKGPLPQRPLAVSPPSVGEPPADTTTLPIAMTETESAMQSPGAVAPADADTHDTSTADAAAGPAVTADPAAPAASPAVPLIVIGAKADVWLTVQNEEGRTLLARVLSDGETWSVPAQPGLRLSTGNAGATTVSIDGETWPSLGSSGSVRHDLPLDASLLSIAILQTRKSKRSAAERAASRDGTKNHPAASNSSATASR